MRLTLLSLAVIASANCMEWNSTHAAQISASDFGSSAIVERFEGLNLPFLNSGPLVIGGNTYSTNDGTIRVHDSFGWIAGGEAFGLGTNGPRNAVEGHANFFIEFNVPVRRAGLNLGEDYEWKAQVAFYDSTDALLGSVAVAAPGSLTGLFAPFVGWEAEQIKRIRVTQLLDSTRILRIDNVTTEFPVPEPNGLALISAGTIAILRRRRSLASMIG